jgi:hypothetical protein
MKKNIIYIYYSFCHLLLNIRHFKKFMTSLMSEEKIYKKTRQMGSP